MKPKFITALFLALHTFYAVNSNAQANRALSNLIATAVNQDLIPNADNTRNLGSTSFSWRSIYFDRGLFSGGFRVFRAQSQNIFAGANAGASNTSGTSNAAFGFEALFSNKTGNNNTASGNGALRSNTGSNNTAVGDISLNHNTTGFDNTAVGVLALYTNTGGGNNTAIGAEALERSTTASYNTASGSFALFNNTEGRDNTASGFDALAGNTTGSNNTACGSTTLITNSTGSNNTALGFFADVNQGNLTNSTAIGANAIATASNQIMLGSTSVNSVKAAGSFVIYSDGRFKKNIKENVPGLDFIKGLRPVTYNYDIHGLNNYLKGNDTKKNTMKSSEAASHDEEAINAKERKLYSGFVAQEVEETASKFGYDFSGVYKPANDKDVYGLSYAEFVVPLVKAVQELSNKNDDKDKMIEELKAKNNELENRLAKVEAIVLSNNSSAGNISVAYIKQNMPNPFNNTTVVNYYTPAAAQIQITDMKGAVIRNYSINKGTGQLTISKTQLAPGTYNYTLYVGGNKIDTKRMIIER